jgi:hypothetical protein
MLTDSKEAIRSRMIRTASGLWGFSDTQDINTFDPIVGMIFGAMAEELHGIATEIKKTDARIIEKLYELLFSQHIFTQFPAHAIARARPSQPQVTISENYQFSYIRKVPRTVNKETVHENKAVFFTPVSEVTLFKGELKYISMGNQLYEISDQVKEPVGTTETGSISDYSKIFIGLKFDHLIEKLDGLSILFEIKNKQSEERFYSLLSSARWSINNREIIFRQGLETEPPEGRNALMEMLRLENDISYKTCRFVTDYYQRRFMTAGKGGYYLKSLAEAGSLPADFRKRFPSFILKSIPSDILWIEAELFQPVPSEVFSDLTVSINCFPVINRELKEFTQTMTQGINIIPLHTDDLFFDIRNVTDSKGTVYKSLHSYSNEADGEEGYWIRQGGVARFDSRDAAEALLHLTELVRDERAAFAMLGTDLVSSELKQLDQIITRMKQRLDSANLRNDSKPYLMLNCRANYERVFVQFWSTCGELANNIRADSRMEVHKGSEIENGSVALVTNTIGGRQQLSKEDKMNKLRRALLSKGRIVTVEDIKALCFEHFGNDLSRVEIKKGVCLDPSPRKGMSRSLDIYLTLNKLHPFTEEDLLQKTESLKVILKNESVNLLPFRIFVS